jgi:hypothetical protein
MKYLVLFLTVCLTQALHAQDSSSVVVHKDPRLDALIRKQGEINETARKTNARITHGFRIMVANTNKREEAIAAKTKVYTYFPELKAYLIYQAPFFKLKAGNFKTREEAERYQKTLSVYFPKGVFIVNDMIELRPEQENGNDK